MSFDLSKSLFFLDATMPDKIDYNNISLLEYNNEEFILQYCELYQIDVFSRINCFKISVAMGMILRPK